MDWNCAKKGCSNLGTHQVWLEFYPPSGLYEGSSAQLLFPDLVFCEEHVTALEYQDLIFPEQIAGMFQHLGRTAPDFSRTQVKSQVIQPEGVPV